MKNKFNMAAIVAAALVMAGCAIDPSTYSGQSYSSASSDSSDSQPAVVVEPVPVYVPNEPSVVVVDPAERSTAPARVERPERVVEPSRPANVEPRPHRPF
jgi:uncharacterized lipoprotein YmbA